MNEDKTTLDEMFECCMYAGTEDIGNLFKEYEELKRSFVDLYEYSKKVEKALDKACELLTYDQFNAIPPKELLNFCMKDWKEWLMNDE